MSIKTLNFIKSKIQSLEVDYKTLLEHKGLTDKDVTKSFMSNAQLDPEVRDLKVSLASLKSVVSNSWPDNEFEEVLVNLFNDVLDFYETSGLKDKEFINQVHNTPLKDVKGMPGKRDIIISTIIASYMNHKIDSLGADTAS